MNTQIIAIAKRVENPIGADMDLTAAWKGVPAGKERHGVCIPVSRYIFIA